MPKAILGKKIGMTQIFSPEGKIIPVTVIEAGPCVVTQVKTKASDDYEAIQIGFDVVREKLINKAQKGHLAKAGVGPLRSLRELRLEDASVYQPGQEIKVDIFAEGELVDVEGISKMGTSPRTNESW